MTMFSAHLHPYLPFCIGFWQCLFRPQSPPSFTPQPRLPHLVPLPRLEGRPLLLGLASDVVSDVSK